MGGLEIDENSNAVDQSGKAIPGLYAAGGISTEGSSKKRLRRFKKLNIRNKITGKVGKAYDFPR